MLVDLVAAWTQQWFIYRIHQCFVSVLLLLNLMCAAVFWYFLLPLAEKLLPETAYKAVVLLSHIGTPAPVNGDDGSRFELFMLQKLCPERFTCYFKIHKTETFLHWCLAKSFCLAAQNCSDSAASNCNTFLLSCPRTFSWTVVQSANKFFHAGTWK